MPLTGSPTWSALGITTGAGKYGSLPLAVSAGMRTIHLLVGQPSISAQYTPLCSADAAFILECLQVYAKDETYPRLDANGVITYSPLSHPFPTVLSAVLDPAGASVYVDGHAPGYYPTGRTPAAVGDPGQCLLGAFGPAPNAVGWEGPIYRALFYAGVHTPGQVLAAAAGIRAAHAVRGLTFNAANPNTWNTLVFYGDSRTAGFEMGSIAPARSYTKYNYGVAGTNSTQIAAMAADGGGLAKPGATRSVAVIWGGVNDGGTAGTAPGVFANLRAACLALRAAGFLAIVCTEISSSGTGDAYKNAVNALLLDGVTGWTAFADGVVRYDQTDLGADGAYAGADFADGLHPSAGGRTKLYVALVAAVDAQG